MIIGKDDVQYSAIYQEWQKQKGKQITWSGVIYRVVKDNDEVRFAPVVKDSPFAFYERSSVGSITTSGKKP